jgi:hypothetical protein
MTEGGDGNHRMLSSLLASTSSSGARPDHDTLGNQLARLRMCARWLQAQALEASSDLLRTRWLVLGLVGSSVPRPFLIILMAWLTLLFASFGLFAPRNPIVISALSFCALSVASAILLILELDTPFTGLLEISDGPIRYALSQMGR